MIACKNVSLVSRLVALLFVPISSTWATENQLQVTGGMISGTTEAGVRTFKGIPFAAPPVGDLRWKPPRPVVPWDGVRVCAEFGPACPQTIIPEDSFYAFTNQTKQSEDCLYLNVWTATASTNERLPVMVWYHGGGLTRCSGADPRFNGVHLAKKGVVLVTVNYRLGPLGYLAHPELTSEEPKGVSGNYGVLDQIAALHWVRQNIGQFGGNADNVTIFGQSAGSWSVQTLVASPLAKGLFHRAIGHSGGLFGALRHLHDSEGQGRSGHQIGRDFLAACGVTTIADARAISSEKIIEVAVGKGRAFYTRPVVDGWLLPSPIEEIFQSGKQNDVPVMVGCTANEMTSLTSRSGLPKTTAALNEKLVGQYAHANFDAFTQAYGGGDDDTSEDAYLALLRNSSFASQMRRWARATGNVSSHVFLYYFTHSPPIPNSGYLRAYHSADVPYAFQTIDPSLGEADRVLSDAMSDYWVNFARKGNPNGEGLPEWAPYNLDTEPYIELGSPLRAGNHLLKQELDYFERLLLEK